MANFGDEDPVNLGIWKHVPVILTLGWGSLNDFLNNRLVKSSAIWLAITPIFAKLFKNVDFITSPLLEGKITLSLPFSWACFFYAALFFSIASLLFNIYCPRSIRNYKNLQDFKEKDFSKAHIKNLFHEDTPRKEPGIKDIEKVFDYYFSTWADNAGLGLTMMDVQAKGEIFNIDQIVNPNPDNAYMALRSTFNLSHIFVRLCITISLYSGMAFLIFVLAQNIGFVFSETPFF